MIVVLKGEVNILILCQHKEETKSEHLVTQIIFDVWVKLKSDNKILYQEHPW